jgi:hypothetical protein
MIVAHLRLETGGSQVAKALSKKRVPLRVNARVELTQEGARRLPGTLSKIGTVVKFGPNGTVYVLRDGYRVATKFPVGLWRIIEYQE